MITERVSSQLNAFNKLYLETENMNKEIAEKISQIDLIITDIEHDIELKKLNAVELMSQVKQLKSALKIRRQIKDDFMVITSIMARLKNANMSVVEKQIDKLDNRTYAQRIAYELREQILNSIED